MGIVKPGGEVTWINVTAAPIPIQELGVLIAYNDITRRRQIENALLENEERLRLALKASNDVVWDWDIANDSQRWNEAGMKIFGWTEIVEKPVNATWWVQRLHPEDCKRVEKGFFAAVKNKSRNKWQDEYRFRKADNSYVEVFDRGYILRNNHGVATRMIGVMLNISERKKAEEILQESEKRYRGLITNLDAGVMVHAPDTSIVMSNPKASELLGLSEEQMKGKVAIDPQWKFIHENKQPLNISEYPVMQIVNTKKAIKNKVYGVCRTKGDIVWLMINGFPALNTHGEISEIVISFVNITEHKKSITALKRIEWMLSEKKVKKESFKPEYGDLSKLNENGLIIKSVTKEQLLQIASEYLDLLETSSAIYEKNGDYALGLFSSSWCQLMDHASRKLCKTKSHRKALDSGKWLCHESCWRDASMKAIESGKPADVKCNGGIRLYAVPILAGGETVGAINFGYGNPPETDEELQNLSELYQIPLEELRKKGQEYQIRPHYIIEYAKKRIQASAKYLGNLIDHKQAELLLLEKNKEIATRN